MKSQTFRAAVTPSAPTNQVTPQILLRAIAAAAPANYAPILHRQECISRGWKSGSTCVCKSQIKGLTFRNHNAVPLHSVAEHSSSTAAHVTACGEGSSPNCYLKHQLQPWSQISSSLQGAVKWKWECKESGKPFLAVTANIMVPYVDKIHLWSDSGYCSCTRLESPLRTIQPKWVQELLSSQ